MENPKQYFSGAPWEKEFGYARALRVGDRVIVSGTTSVVDGEVAHPFNPEKQTEVIFDIFEKALKNFDLTLKNTIKVQLFITDKSFSDAVMKVYQKRLNGVYPTATLLVVNGLIDDRLCVEIGMEAYAQKSAFVKQAE